MSVINKTDVKSIWFKNLNGERCVINVAENSLSRVQASELLQKITAGIKQGTNDCGFTCVGGGECRAWW